MAEEKPNKLGDEAPELKHYLIVFLAFGLLTGLSWVMWFKWGWFH